MNPKLIIFDMDGVIFQGRNFWMKVHEAFGTLEQGKTLTEKYLHSDYETLVQKVVNELWKDKDATPYFELVKSVPYIKGVPKLFAHIKNKDFITVIITAGSIDLARRAQKDFGIDHVYGNELVIQNNKVTGEFIWPIAAGREKKVEIIEHLCDDLNISPKEIIYIGDDKPDIEAFKIVGKAIAFCPKIPELKELAHHVIEDEDISKAIPLIN